MQIKEVILALLIERDNINVNQFVMKIQQLIIKTISFIKVVDHANLKVMYLKAMRHSMGFSSNLN